MTLKKNVILDFVLNGIQVGLRKHNKTATDTVRQQIEQTANMTEICTPAKSYEPLNKTSFALQDHVLKTGAVLVFHCSDKIAKKIKGLKTVTGNELVEEKKNERGNKELHIWNEKTQSRDVQEEIFSDLDRKSGAQSTMYYDKQNNRVSFNFGGTDFTNPNDLRSAAQTMSGSMDMRMTMVKENIANGMKEFEKRYPGKIKETSVDLFAHSSGANALPLANYFLRRGHNIEPRSQVALDPFGMKNSFDGVAEMIATAEGRERKDVLNELSHNTASYKVETKTFIDHLNYLDRYNHNGPAKVEKAVGVVEHLQIHGNVMTAHMGKSWIQYFNAMEVRRLDPAVQMGIQPSTGAKNTVKA